MPSVAINEIPKVCCESWLKNTGLVGGRGLVVECSLGVGGAPGSILSTENKEESKKI